jgi:hypothetical protein
MLVVFLAFPVYEQIPETGEELAANPDFKVGITCIGGAFRTFLRTSKSSMIMNSTNRMELNCGFHCIISTIAQYVRRRFALCMKTWPRRLSIRTVFFHLNEGKVQKKAPVHLHSFLAGLLMAKRSVIAPNFSATVIAALNAGLLEDWERQDFRNKRLQTFSNAKTNNIKHQI